MCAGYGNDNDKDGNSHDEYGYNTESQGMKTEEWGPGVNVKDQGKPRPAEFI